VTNFNTPPTFVAGNVLTAAQLNSYLRDNPLALYEILTGANAVKIPFAAHDNNAWVVPQCHVRLTTSWVMVNNAATAINFSAADIWDTDTIHDTATNNTRLTPHTKGLYLCYATLAFPANATGERFVSIRLNGTTDIGKNEVPVSSASAQTTLPALAPYQLNGSTDYIEMLYFQNSGGSLTNPGAGNVSTEFGIVWLSSY
jgi:hypothetical protein